MMKPKLHFPPIGQRIVKTSVAVLLCLAVYALRGYRGQDMPTEAAITAIICMQPYMRDTREYAVSRLIGTLIGAFWGLMFLLLLVLFPALGQRAYVLYPLMAAHVLVTLYTTVALQKPDTSCQAAIVILCVVIAYPDIEEPLLQALYRIIGVLVGTAIAIGVNVFRLPRAKRQDLLLFVRTRDLVPDQLAQVSPSVLFRLNHLNKDGARICLMSQHAPAFFMSQMSAVRLNVPMIVMDGAALYDPGNNDYLSVIPIPPAISARLMAELDQREFPYFIYTVHGSDTCIYHHGRLNGLEKAAYENMKRSPYRRYLNEDAYDPKEIVYIKVIARLEIARGLQSALSLPGLRSVIREQAGLQDGVGLYYYAQEATSAQAQNRLLRIMRAREPRLQPVEVFSEKGYRSENDAVHLLHRLGKTYEPLRLFFNRKKRKKRSY